MNVKLIEVKSGNILDAIIEEKNENSTSLPSIHNGWRFDFQKHSKNPRYRTYLLYCNRSPDIIEGCLIFEMRDKVEPYMAYVEISPANRNPNKEKKNVGECLIAFACRLSFLHGKDHYQGWLAFDVLEEDKNDERQLMALYSTKYHALRFGASTTMIIPPEGGEKLINEFLN